MNSIQFYTYLYLDPKDGTPRYIGKGKGRRAKEHLSSSRNPQLRAMLRKRQRDGYEVKPIIHNEVDEFTAFRMEEFWINFYGRQNTGTGTLFNLTDGGESPAGAVYGPHSDEYKQRHSERMKGVNLGKQRTQEQKEHQAKVHLGKRHSEEFSIKRAKTLAATPAEVIAERNTKRSAALKGKPWSAARKAAWEQSRK